MLRGTVVPLKLCVIVIFSGVGIWCLARSSVDILDLSAVSRSLGLGHLRRADLRIFGGFVNVVFRDLRGSVTSCFFLIFLISARIFLIVISGLESIQSCLFFFFIQLFSV